MDHALNGAVAAGTLCVCHFGLGWVLDWTSGFRLGLGLGFGFGCWLCYVCRVMLAASFCRVLRRVVLSQVALRCVALRCVVLCCVVLRCVVLCCVVLRCVALC